MLRADQWLPRRVPIGVEIGAAIRPTGKDFTDILRLRDAVRKEILASCGEPDLNELDQAARAATRVSSGWSNLQRFGGPAACRIVVQHPCRFCDAGSPITIKAVVERVFQRPASYGFLAGFGSRIDVLWDSAAYGCTSCIGFGAENAIEIRIRLNLSRQQRTAILSGGYSRWFSICRSREHLIGRHDVAELLDHVFQSAPMLVVGQGGTAILDVERP